MDQNQLFEIEQQVINNFRINKLETVKIPSKMRKYSYEQLLKICSENMWNKDALGYDVHVWIGKSSTSDEFSTAARKSIELDTFLGGKTIQHNEVS